MKNHFFVKLDPSSSLSVFGLGNMNYFPLRFSSNIHVGTTDIFPYGCHPQSVFIYQFHHHRTNTNCHFKKQRAKPQQNKTKPPHRENEFGAQYNKSTRILGKENIINQLV